MHRHRALLLKYRIRADEMKSSLEPFMRHTMKRYNESRMEDDDILLINVDDGDPLGRGPVKNVDMSEGSSVRRRMKEPLSISAQRDIKLGKFGSCFVTTAL
jgi:hypothetical protein